MCDWTRRDASTFPPLVLQSGFTSSLPQALLCLPHLKGRRSMTGVHQLWKHWVVQPPRGVCVCVCVCVAVWSDCVIGFEWMSVCVWDVKWNVNVISLVCLGFNKQRNYNFWLQFSLLVSFRTEPGGLRSAAAAVCCSCDWLTGGGWWWGWQ